VSARAGTRRQLAARLAAGGSLLGAAAAPGRRQGDVLAGLLARQRATALAYERSAREGGLGREDRSLVEVCGRQERRHVEALEGALAGQGAGARDGPGPLPELERALGAGRDPVLALLIDLERRSLRAFYVAQAALRTPALLATTAGIMGNDAQHLALLRQALGRDPSPEAFVTGR